MSSSSNKPRSKAPRAAKGKNASKPSPNTVPKASEFFSKGFVSNPRLRVTRYRISPRVKRLDFHAPLPDKKKRREMSRWDQAGPMWGAWRKERNSLGASSVISTMPGGSHSFMSKDHFLGASDYHTADTFMQYCAGFIDDSLKYHRGYGLPAMLGHINEDLVGLGFLAVAKQLDPEAEISLHEVGVIYNLTEGFNYLTASLDFNVKGGESKRLAEILRKFMNVESFSWSKCLVEAKSPCLKKYDPTSPDNPEAKPQFHRFKLQGFPKDYIFQCQDQLSCSRSQGEDRDTIEDGDDPLMLLPEKEFNFLAVMEVPYKDRVVDYYSQPPSTRVEDKNGNGIDMTLKWIEDVEGKETAIVAANKPFTMKLWVTRFDPKFEEIMKKYLTKFVRFYDRMEEPGREDIYYTFTKEECEEVEHNYPQCEFLGQFDLFYVAEDVVIEAWRKPKIVFKDTEEKNEDGLSRLILDIHYPLDQQ